MPDTEWYVLCVDDEAERAEEVRDYLDGESVGDQGVLRIEVQTSFDAGLRALDRGHYDVVILDVRHGDPRHDSDGEEAGRKVLEEIKARRFLPVVFYTGLPGAVGDLRSPLIRVVEKTAGLERLLEEVRDVFEGGLPAVNRALVLGLERVQRDYLWTVGATWQSDDARRNSGELLYVLSRRLAASMSGPMISDLAQAVGSREPSAGDSRHPAQLYIAPPVTADPHPGEIVQRTTSEGAVEHLIILTPACDIVQGRADFVLLARCLPLADQEEYQAWAQADEPTQKISKRLTGLLCNNRVGERERYRYLPSAFQVPDLIIDFQQLETVASTTLSEFMRIAALDAPFAQAMLAQFVRYFGRIGTPDLDIDGIMERLLAERNR